MKNYYYWVALVVLVLDQITKRIVSGGMEVGDQISVIGEFFKIHLYKNNGAAFSILPNQRLFFIVMTIAVVIGIIWYIRKNRSSGRALLMVSLGLILGGAIGNLVDRALYGEVVDFFKLTFGSYIFPIFNIADIGITIGVVLILLDTMLDAKNQRAKAPGNGDIQRRQPIERSSAVVSGFR
ncbi:signal peptidase II [Paenibacillus methanolicus]|uniref:Lipoprotein signal peptidase n=1 Tax=Paenibacillus methanolicus TaxID=582686 RepID=A0A5S5C405_9BACL|nr:signal peptidase II [Paenibacillus methanolicus]TYP73060.1 signal peptidase II [Paenibacillus methanolicus]